MFGQINLITHRPPSLSTHDFVLGRDMRYNLQSAKLFKSNSSKCRAEDLNSNVAGTLISKDGQMAFTFNLMPGIHSIEYLKQFFTRKTDEVKTAFAFLCGGCAYDGKNDITAASTGLYAGLANIFDDLNVPLGMVCGKLSPKKSDNLQVHGHVINLWGDNTYKLKPLSSRSEIKEVLENEYDVVEFPDSVGIAAFEKEPSYAEANNFYTSMKRLKEAN